jgi:integrase/recombinase XerD
MAVASELRPLLRPWLSALAQRSEATALNYEVAAREFLDLLGDRELDPGAIADYVDSLTDRGLAPGTRATKISVVRSLLKVAQAQGLVDRSPVDFLIRPRVAVTSYGRFLALNDLKRLVAAARRLGPVNEAVVVTLAATGLRVSELAGARWKDLYRDPHGRLGLRVVHGKGGKERLVKIRDDVWRTLVELHGSSELDPGDTSPLIPNPWNGRPYTSRTLWTRVHEAVVEAGLSDTVSPHWLRHTAATLSAAGGASPFVLQAGLGHSSLETSTRYVHIARGLSETMVDSLPSFD